MEIRLHDAPACDFCGSLEPRWLFPCRNYQMADIVPSEGLLPPQESTGGWLACHTCAPYVHRENWNGLARRCLAGGGINPTIRAAVQGLDPDLVQRGVIRTWKQFSTNRVGPVIEWKP